MIELGCQGRRLSSADMAADRFRTLTNEHWFVDETKATGFSLVAVGFDGSDVGYSRAKMLRLTRLPGRKGSALHFTKENDATRSASYQVIKELPIVSILVIRPATGSHDDPRQEAMRAMAKIARERRPQRIVIERDTSVEHLDKRWLHEELAGLSGIEYQHLGKKEDPLLWVADGIAWALNRGGRWWALLENLPVEFVATS